MKKTKETHKNWKLNRYKRLVKKLGSDCPVDMRIARQSRKQQLEIELKIV